jgi:hypothetical protein
MHQRQVTVSDEFASEKHIAYDLCLAQMANESAASQFARRIDDLPRVTGGRNTWASHSAS